MRRRQAKAEQPAFNEAAGIPRGRLAHRVKRDIAKLPSMRPRVFPAEDGWIDAGSSRTSDLQ